MAITGLVWVGTDGTTTVEFKDADGNLLDPEIVTLSFSLGSGLPYTVWTFGGVGSIIRLGEGNYKAVVDTSGGSVSSTPNLSVVWRGKQGLNAVGVAAVKLNNPPA